MNFTSNSFLQRSSPDVNLRIVAPLEYDDLRKQLREWCDAEHGRQKQIADMLGVSKQLVSMWLSGRRIMSVPEWLKIQSVMKRNKTRRPRKSDNARKKAIGEEQEATRK